MQPKVAIVGCGNWGQNLLRELIELDIKPIVIDNSKVNREWASKNYGCPVLESVEQIDSIYDGAIVATPAETHVEIALEIAGAARNLYIEKPLAMDSVSAESLVNSHGDRVFCLEKWRYHPAIEAISKAVGAGVIGEVSSIETWRISNGMQTRNADILWTLLPHDISIVRHIIGYLPPVESGIMEYKGVQRTGVIATLGREPRVQIEVSANRPEYLRRVEVSGERGNISFDLARPDRFDLEIRNKGTQQTVSQVLPTKIQMTAVVNHLKGGDPPFSTSREGLESVCCVESIITKSESEPGPNHGLA